MKFHILLATASMLALAACGGSGDSDIGGGGGGGGGTGNPPPGGGVVDPGDLPVTGDETCGTFVCSGDVVNISYNATDDELTLTGLPFDDDPLGAVYTPFTTVNGYTVYRNNEPGTFNQYLAIHRDTGAIAIGVAAIEGYQEYGYTGAWYDVDDLTTSIPATDLIQYLGDYAGTMTFIGTGDLLLTDGELEMEVDFTDGYLKGFIRNRDVFSVDAATGVLTDIGDRNTLVLNDTIITDGTFEGTVNSYDTDGSVIESGTYQGFFGGSGATEIGGLVRAIGEYDFNPLVEADDDTFIARDLGVFTGSCLPVDGADPSC